MHIPLKPLVPATECLSSLYFCRCCCTVDEVSETDDDNYSTINKSRNLLKKKSSSHPSPTTGRSQSASRNKNHKTFNAQDKDDRIEELLDSLSSDELEIAARCDYNYLKHPQPEQRRLIAQEMAVRYLRSKHDTKRALEHMKATIAFRRDLDIDRLRLAFDDTNDSNDSYRQKLEECLSNKMVYVQGYDKEGRATYIFEPYRVQQHDKEWTIKQHVWTLERAIACTKVHDKTVNAVINFNGFSAYKNSPPREIGKQFLDTLRNHYIGHVNQIFIIDAPRTFSYLWAIFKPMLSKATKDKIKFISYNKEKVQKLGKLYSSDQATPWMLPTGEKRRDLDIHEYLFETSFDKAFDE